ncbi:hypothetical protein BDB00DRAFT_793547 [Zychaea mexicana]|uniref:uncharacterized protein n=1 Tax=Zychaea mexicana TaxID=64656 RepID=UPI0022FF0BD3|nr:uncharacterized protein BDB00DRAFT_793547 [Zychaea mexicana]KAI9472493.1 hypothetical protein BDB00DRAFT_793547 [Zychaea mexicana]
MYENLTHQSPTLGNQQVTTQIHSLLTALEQQELRRQENQQQLFSRIEEWRNTNTGAASVTSQGETHATAEQPLISAIESLTLVLQQCTERSTNQLAASSSQGDQHQQPAQSNRPTAMVIELSSEPDDRFETPSDDAATEHDDTTRDSNGSSGNRQMVVRVARQNETVA